TEEHALEVDAQDTVELVLGGVDDAVVDDDAGHVGHHVDAAVGVDGEGHQGGHVALTGDVGTKRRGHATDLRHCFLQPRLVEVAAHDGGTGRRESHGAGAADAAGGAGDDGDLAVDAEPVCHVLTAPATIGPTAWARARWPSSSGWMPSASCSAVTMSRPVTTPTPLSVATCSIAR